MQHQTQQSQQELKQTLQLRLIYMFGLMKCDRRQQIDLIAYALNCRKNVMELEIDELKKVLLQVTGHETGVAI